MRLVKEYVRSVRGMSRTAFPGSSRSKEEEGVNSSVVDLEKGSLTFTTVNPKQMKKS
jgi:hypothetical protein